MEFSHIAWCHYFSSRQLYNRSLHILALDYYTNGFVLDCHSHKKQNKHSTQAIVPKHHVLIGKMRYCIDGKYLFMIRV